MTETTLTAEQLADLRKLAEAATPQNFDSAEVKNSGDFIECPTCQGEGEIEIMADYCNYDGTAIGVQFYGVGKEFGLAEAYYRAANPKTVLALIAAAERAPGLVADYQRVEQIAQTLEAERDDALERAEAAEARVASLEAALDQLISRKSTHFTARNGRLCSIEDADGERMYLVPCDCMGLAEGVLAGSPPASQPQPMTWTEKLMAEPCKKCGGLHQLMVGPGNPHHPGGGGTRVIRCPDCRSEAKP